MRSLQRRRRFHDLVPVLLTVLMVWAAVPTHSAAPETVTVAILPIAASALFIVARQQGYFEQQGLHVELLMVESGPEALAALEQGRAVFATSSETPVAVDVVQGGESCVVAQMASAVGHIGILGRRDRGVNSVADLAGKRVGVTPGSNGEYFLHAALMLHKLPDSAVSEVALPPERMAQALMDGKVDAVSTWEPALQSLAGRLGANAYTYRTPWLYRTAYLLSTTRGFANRHPKRSTALLRALNQALERVRRDPAQLERMIGEQSREGRGESLQGYGFELRLDQALPEILEMQTAWAARHQGIDAARIPNVLPFICPAPLKEVLPDAVTLIPDPAP